LLAVDDSCSLTLGVLCAHVRRPGLHRRLLQYVSRASLDMRVLERRLSINPPGCSSARSLTATLGVRALPPGHCLASSLRAAFASAPADGAQRRFGMTTTTAVFLCENS